MKNSNPNSVIFLALSGIGNLVMQLPTIAALKHAHPDWHVTVWVAPRGTAQLAKAQPYIDEVLEMPIKNSITGHISTIQLLRKRRYGNGIVLSPGQLMKSAGYLYLAGVPMRIGNAYPLGNNAKSSFLLTNAINENEDLHDIEQNLQLLNPLNIYPNPVPFYSIQIPNTNKKEAKRILDEYNFKPNTSIIGIHAGSAPNFTWKRWPLERFVEVAIALLEKDNNVKILLFGDNNELEQNGEIEKAIHKKFPDAARTVSASLMTTASLLSYCKFLISNDSGLMHLAAASGTQVISLFGPTSEIQTGPRGKGSVVVRAPGTIPVYNTELAPSMGTNPHETMLAITPKMVLDQISS